VISLQTNVTSLIAQSNLNTDNQFQSKTIQQLTSGYRINSSGDDAAGLAIANSYRSSIAELTQGLSNAIDGVSQLQIVDGGLSNISTILDRLKTLATESASSTFTGDRATLNHEYSGLVSEVTRQATNVNLNDGGSLNAPLKVFVGGGSDTANSSVTVDLSGAHNAVDASSLGLTSPSVTTTTVVNGGVGLPGNTQSLSNPGAAFLSGSATGSESFKFNLATGAGAQTVTATVNGSLAGIPASAALSQLNSQLNQYGITASLNTAGLLQFNGATPFNLMSADLTASTNSALVTQNAYVAYGIVGGNGFGLSGADTETLTVQSQGTTVSILLNSANAGSMSNAIATIDANVPQGGSWFANTDVPQNYLAIVGYDSMSVSSTSSNVADEFLANGNATISWGDRIFSNTANYSAYGLYSLPTAPVAETLSINAGGQPISVALTVADQASPASVEAAINAQTAQYGVFALTNCLGTGVDLQSASAFTVSSDVAGVFAANSTAVNAPVPGSSPTTITSTTAATTTSVDTVNNAKAAITAINSAVQALGLVQGSVGAGENTLAYAMSLAHSQITGFSGAESQIRDADVAAQAANLTKAQVLIQTSVAALAQANSAPQAMLKLLQHRAGFGEV